MRFNILLDRTRCPVCESKISLLSHTFLNDLTGVKCSSCGSLLGHSLIVKLIKYSLLIIMVISLSYKHQNVIWWFSFILSLIGVLYVQLCSHFTVLLQGKSLTRKIDQ